MLFTDLRLPSTAQMLDNHKAYVQSWIADLEKDPLILFQAIKDAEKISDYVLKNGPVALEKIRENQRMEDLTLEQTPVMEQVFSI